MKFFKILVTIFTLLLITAVTSVAFIIYTFNKNLPNLDSLKNYNPPTVTKVYADNGVLIGEFYKEKRIYVNINKIPKIVKDAFISAEDQNFYNHKGLDIMSILRALVVDIKAGKIIQGGSTITQQVVKSFLLNPEKTFQRKIKEVILAYKIENFLTKDEILNLYLNQIYLGYESYGVAAAIENYFGKNIDQVTLAEAAMIAGLPKAPSSLNPAKHFTKAKERQHYVLTQMVNNGIITNEEAINAFKEDIKIKERVNYSKTLSAYYLDYISQYMIEKYGRDAFLSGGFKIYTGLNLKYQAFAQESLRDGLEELEQRKGFSGAIENVSKQSFKYYAEKLKEENGTIQGGKILKALVTYIDKPNNYAVINLGNITGYIRFADNKWISYKRSRDGEHKTFVSEKIGDILNIGDVVQVTLLQQVSKTYFFKVHQKVEVNGAIISVEPNTGLVRAMIGGYSYQENQFNRAFQAKRLPGSAFKPIIYAAAFEKGYSPASILLDTPEVFYDTVKNEYWKPENYEKKFYGPTSLRTGLVHSRNVLTVKLLKEVGIDYVDKFAKKLKISSPLNRDLSMALGSSAMTLFEITRAYSFFANGGRDLDFIFVKKLVDKSGKVIENNFNLDKIDLTLSMQENKAHIISPQVAYLTTSVLEDVIKDGTGRRVKELNRPCAGKTGTTNDYVDAWFIGYTPDLLTGVYVGYDKTKPLGYLETGSKAAAPIWLNFMKQALENITPKMFQIPPKIVFRKIDSRNGLLATNFTPPDYVKMEAFMKGSEPVEYSTLKTADFIKNELK